MVGRIVISDIVLRKSHRSLGRGGGSRSLDLPLRSATDDAAPLFKTQNLKVVEVIEFLFTFEYWCLDREWRKLLSRKIFIKLKSTKKTNLNILDAYDNLCLANLATSKQLWQINFWGFRFLSGFWLRQGGMHGNNYNL